MDQQSARSTSSIEDLSSSDRDDSELGTYGISGVLDRTILETFLNRGVNANTMIFYSKGGLDTNFLKIAGLRSGDSVDFEAWGLKSGWGANAGNLNVGGGKRHP